MAKGKAQKRNIPTIADVENAPNEYAKRILLLCREKQTNLYDIAFKGALPLNSVKRAVKGVNIGIENLEKICCGLNVSLQEFFASEDFSEVGIKTDRK